MLKLPNKATDTLFKSGCPILAKVFENGMETLKIHFFVNGHQNKKLLRIVVAFDPVLLQDMIVSECCSNRKIYVSIQIRLTALNSFNNMFLVTHQVHSYGTRSSGLFFIYHNAGLLNIRKFSISFQGPYFFTSLSSAVS